MTSKIYLVTDLGPGDGGKGGVVHKISHLKRAHTILKAGGAQGSHGVHTSAGETFAFSQWGCGTFEGVKTHITTRMVVSPEGLLNEAESLHYQAGIWDPFSLLTVDENCLCATPYHAIASRLKEMALRGNPRGTIGTGVGDAYRDAANLPNLIIQMRDLHRSDLKDMLGAVREYKQKELAPIIEAGFLPADQELVQKEIDHLYDPGFLDYVVDRFQEVAKRVTIVDGLESILKREGIAVVETSHGILTDNRYGFSPHTSAIRTLPSFNEALLRDAGYKEKIVNIGVSRAYAIRHGAGPLPTASSEMSERLLPGSNKHENRYQGKVRVGPMDLVLLRYAIDVCGGPKAFDALAITWFDQVTANGRWDVCDSYKNSEDTFFDSSGKIKVYNGSDWQSHQKNLGASLLRCEPNIVSYDTPNVELCGDLMKQSLNIPVGMISVGPNETHKILLKPNGKENYHG